MASKASIIILTYNNLAYTQQCVDSILAHTQHPNYEVILVDNASTDETPAYLQAQAAEHPQIRILLQETNLGFSGGNNAGAQIAQGDHLVFLNNDVIVTPGWLQTLLGHLADRSVGMVGPVTNAIGNEARIIVDYEVQGNENLVEDMHAFAERYTHAHKGEVFEIPMLALYCVAMRRSVWDEVGPLDERFGRGMFEDDDYALRVKEKGYKIICAEDVFIHHWGNMSFSRLETIDYWQLFLDNRKLFQEKWGIKWRPQMYRPELLPEQIGQLADSSAWLGDQLIGKEKRITHLEWQIRERDGVIRARENKIEALNYELSEIYKSKAWAIGQWFRETSLKVTPVGSRRARLAGWGIRQVVSTRKKWLRIQNNVRRKRNFRMSWYAYAFDRYKRARHEVHTPRLGKVRCPSVPGLVSIVLPVYNGADYVAESIDSILRQTYTHFELLVVDDGSTDDTPQILAAYVQQDDRVRVINQQNQRLPAALSNGFRQARGEFLTWTSDDNRMKPDFLEKLVGNLQARPDWEMIYANQDIIDLEGSPLQGSAWFANYQDPPGSEHVMLPTDPSTLNIWPNNYVGAAFMYRDRADYLLGDYSAFRFGTEDYDYWMRVNGLLNLRHSDFTNPIYDYRFHPKSLTSRDDELGITRYRDQLMVFEDFRRDFYTTPLLWRIETPRAQPLPLAQQIRQWVTEAGHALHDPGVVPLDDITQLWLPSVYLHLADSALEAGPIPAEAAHYSLKVLVLTGRAALPEEADSGWDLCITTDADAQLPRLGRPRQGWLAIPGAGAICTAIDIRTRSAHLSQIEAEIETPPKPSYKFSVVICTYRRGPLLEATLRSVVKQSLPVDDYEIIVINNDFTDTSVTKMVEKVRQSDFQGAPTQFRLIVCPLKGLSFARNVGISEARGEIVSFIDDDAQALPDWLEKLWEGYQLYPSAGLLGGKITLDIPTPRPRWLKPGWEALWSHYQPSYAAPTQVEHWWKFPWGANWSATREALVTIGGFRTNYGRKGKDFSGGEEVVAANLIKRLGYALVVMPEAEVLHAPDASRYTFKHVWNTYKSGPLTNYRQQLDLYLPMRLGIKSLSKDMFYYVSKAFTLKRVSRYERAKYLFYIFNQTRLMAAYFQDMLARFRQPFVRTF